MENKVKLCGNSGDSANSSTRLFLSSFQYLLLEILLELQNHVLAAHGRNDEHVKVT